MLWVRVPPGIPNFKAILAQLAEQQICNLKVKSSNLLVGTKTVYPNTGFLIIFGEIRNPLGSLAVLCIYAKSAPID